MACTADSGRAIPRHLGVPLKKMCNTGWIYVRHQVNFLEGHVLIYGFDFASR